MRHRTRPPRATNSMSNAGASPMSTKRSIPRFVQRRYDDCTLFPYGRMSLLPKEASPTCSLYRGLVSLPSCSMDLSVASRGAGSIWARYAKRLWWAAGKFLPATTSPSELRT